MINHFFQYNLIIFISPRFDVCVNASLFFPRSPSTALISLYILDGTEPFISITQPCATSKLTLANFQKKSTAGPLPLVCNRIPSAAAEIWEGPAGRRNAGQAGVCLGQVPAVARAHRPGEQRHHDKETLEWR